MIQNPGMGQFLDEKVVALPMQVGTPANGSVPSHPVQPQEWSEAVSLVLEAAEAIRNSDGRVRAAEDRCTNLSNEATREIQRLGQALLAAERRFAAAEERATDAQRRAAEAEEQLIKLQSAVTRTLSPLLKGHVAAHAVGVTEAASSRHG